ncbi:MAG: zf-HC2 domain-containing protein [Planctomycetota bacterium]|jgi:negative regulator of sigma E activity
MKNVPQNELLSAYLDGELTAAEQAEVEQLLATTPAARQLVDQWRALRSRLQALPVQRAGRDLRAEVLRRVQSPEATGTDPPEPQKNEPPRPESSRETTVLRRAHRRRVLAWSGVAVSAAVLLLALVGKNLWQPPRGPIALQEPAAEADSLPAGGAAEAPDRAGEMLETEAFLAESADSDSQHHRGDALLGDAEAARSAPLPTQGRKRNLAGAPGGMAPRGGAFGGGFGRELAPAEDEAPAPEKGFATKAKSPGFAAGKPASLGAVTLPNGVSQPGEVLVTLRCRATAEAVPLFEDLLKRQQVASARTGGAWHAQAGPENDFLKLRAQDRYYGAAADGRNEIRYDFEATPDQLVTLVASIKRRPREFSFVPAPRGMGELPEDLRRLSSATPMVELQAIEGLEGAAMFREERTDDPAATRDAFKKRAGAVRGRSDQAEAAIPFDVNERLSEEETAGQGRASRLKNQWGAQAEGEAAVDDSRRSQRRQSPGQMLELNGDFDHTKRAGVAVEPSPRPAAAGQSGAPAPEKDEAGQSADDDADAEEAAPMDSPAPRDASEAEARQPKEPPAIRPLDHVVAKYRVRFVLQIDPLPADVAASQAEQATENDAAAGLIGKPAEAGEPPPAEPATPTKIKP